MAEIAWEGDLDRLIHTVGVTRKLAMLSYDGSFFLGMVSPECWEMVRGILKAMSASGVTVEEDDSG